MNMQPDTSAGFSAGGLRRGPETTAHPADATAWLAGTDSRTVVVLGHPDATLDLADSLTAMGHDVRRSEGGAFTLPDGSVDVVIALGHVPVDLDEIARVVWPRGHVAIVVNDRDRRIPWVAKFDRIFGVEDGPNPLADWDDDGWFSPLEAKDFRFWQWVDRDRLEDLARGLPEVTSILDPDRREALIAQARTLYDDYGRAGDGMQVPWISHCYRAQVVARPQRMDALGVIGDDIDLGGRDDEDDLAPPEVEGEIDTTAVARAADVTMSEPVTHDTREVPRVRATPAPGRPIDPPTEADDSAILLIDFR